MEFLKNLFNEDKQVIGLCAFKKQQGEVCCFKFEPKFNNTKFIYETNTAGNFFLQY